MTPMQSLKNSFDQFKALMPAGVDEAALNKSEGRVHVSMFCGDRQEHAMKGVRSDFIKFFKRREGAEAKSLGFDFSCLGLPPERHGVQASLKIRAQGGEPVYFVGEVLEPAAFRQTFERSIGQAKAVEGASFADMVEIFKANFEMKRRSMKSSKTLERQRRNKRG